MPANNKWTEEIIFLKELANKTGMTETKKWGVPVYTYNGKNILGIAGFKSYLGIWFYNGVFLKDKHKLLVNAQEGTTKALRQMRFTSMDEIDEKIILEYIHEAIENEKKGLKHTPEKKKTVIPDLLQNALDQDAKLKSAFEGFSPSKQREFCEHIESAKQEKTKATRLEKIIPMIMGGVGLNDKYIK